MKQTERNGDAASTNTQHSQSAKHLIEEVEGNENWVKGKMASRALNMHHVRCILKGIYR